MGLADWLSHWAGHRPDHPAVLDDDRTTSYRQLDRRARFTTAWLADRGIGAGDRVAYCGLNRVELIEVLAACERLGAVLLPVNNRLTVAEVGFQLADADPAMALVSDGFGPLMAEAGGPGLPVVDIDDVDIPHAPEIERAPDPSPPMPEPVDGTERPLLMVYTSGTTGQPKGAVHTSRSLLFTVLNGVAHQDLSAADRVLTILPLFHVGGLNIQTLPALYVGATVILQRRFEPGHALELVTRHRPTQTLLVPATMDALLGHPDLDATDLGCLRGINSGSSVVPEHLTMGFIDRGVPVGQVYGATETGPTAVVLRYDDGLDAIGSCGRPALHSQLRLVDGDGVPVPPGQAGEIHIRGPHLFDHYHGRPEDTAAAVVDGWYRTGDVGRSDERGWLHIEDRVKDVVISGGENIYPAEVENVLSQHPGIGGVAVVAWPDPQWGEMPLAVVEAAPGRPTPGLEELQAWCRDRLARYKQPRRLVVVDELPRTALGKVTKHVLRARLIDDLGS